MTEATSIKGMIQGLTGEGIELMQGKVIAADPLRIQMIGDDKLIINERITIIPRHLTDYTATVDIVQNNGTVSSVTSTDGSHSHSYSGETNSAGDPPHTHLYSGETQSKSHSHSLSTFNMYGAKMTVYNALKVGEIVYVLALNKGKLYYILDRVVS